MEIILVSEIARVVDGQLAGRTRPRGGSIGADKLPCRRESHRVGGRFQLALYRIQDAEIESKANQRKHHRNQNNEQLKRSRASRGRAADFPSSGSKAWGFHVLAVLQTQAWGHLCSGSCPFSYFPHAPSARLPSVGTASLSPEAPPVLRARSARRNAASPPQEAHRTTSGWSGCGTDCPGPEYRPGLAPCLGFASLDCR